MEKQIPGYLMEQIEKYIEQTGLPGQFLTSILTNDLRAVVECATQEEIEVLPLCVVYLIKYAPKYSWGNSERFLNWLNVKYTGRECVAQSMRGMEGFVP